MPLLTATNAFRLGRRCWSSPQWHCLHHICTIWPAHPRCAMWPCYCWASCVLCCVSVHQTGGEGDIQADDQSAVINVKFLASNAGSSVIRRQFPHKTRQVLSLQCVRITHTQTHNHLRLFFWDYPGEPVPEESLLLDFVVQGKITEADTPTVTIRIPDGHHSVWTNQRLTSIIPRFYTGIPFCRNPPTLSWLETGTKYAGLHTQWRGCGDISFTFTCAFVFFYILRSGIVISCFIQTIIQKMSPYFF